MIVEIFKNIENIFRQISIYCSYSFLQTMMNMLVFVAVTSFVIYFIAKVTDVDDWARVYIQKETNEIRYANERNEKIFNKQMDAIQLNLESLKKLNDQQKQLSENTNETFRELLAQIQVISIEVGTLRNHLIQIDSRLGQLEGGNRLDNEE